MAAAVAAAREREEGERDFRTAVRGARGGCIFSVTSGGARDLGGGASEREGAKAVVGASERCSSLLDLMLMMIGLSFKAGMPGGLVSVRLIYRYCNLCIEKM